MSSTALGDTAVCEKLITTEIDAPAGAVGAIGVEANLTINGTLLNVPSGTVSVNALSVQGDTVDFNNLPTVAPADSGRLWNNAGVVNIVP